MLERNLYCGNIEIRSNEDVKNMSIAHKIKAADNGLYLDILRTDDNYLVRAAVAGYGRPQDAVIFMNDKDYSVRCVYKVNRK